MRRTSRAALLLMLLAGAPLQAGGSRTLEIDDFRKVEGLKLEGAGLSADGGVVPGPAPTILLGPALPIIWEVQPGRAGQVLIAGGTPGLVARLDTDSGEERVHESPEADITALALIDSSAVAFAVTPGGQVMVRRGDSAARLLLETGARFVWDMLADADRRLWIAAGDPGSLWRIDRDERSHRVLDLGLEQARCLAPAPGGGVYLGTAGGGILRHIRPDGTVEVLLESGFAEIAALAPLPDGGVALALGSAGVSEAAQNVSTPPLPGTGSGGRPTVTVIAGPPSGGPAPARVRSEVVRWDPDRGVERLWSSERETALALLADPDGSLWLGTGPGGAVYRIDATGRTEQVIVLPARAVTRLRRAPDGALLVATAGPGLAVRLERDRIGEGTVQGGVVDLGAGARLGDVEWWSRGTGAVEVALRSGPRSLPDESWSAWTDWQGGGVLAAPGGPTGRFVQWRARLRAAEKPGSRPELARLRLTWLPVNRPPRVERVEVLVPGLGLEVGPQPAGMPQPPPDSPAAAALAAESPGLAPGARPGARRLYAPGRRTVVWEAQDEDSDPLEARLLLRSETETAFVPFTAWRTGHFATFDEAALPDGGYVARVEVSDAPDNDAARARRTHADSARFVVDRTPPVIRDLRWSVSGSTGGTLEFAAEDLLGPLAGARVLIDGGEARPVPAVDGVEDGRTETYRLRLTDLPVGTHAAVIRVRDALGNEGAARLVFAVP